MADDSPGHDDPVLPADGAVPAGTVAAAADTNASAGPVTEPDGDTVLAQALSPEPLVIVISGPSGVGKDEVLKHLQEQQVPFHFVVTATTRPQREGEVHGRDYYFVSVTEFAEMIERDELLEYAVVYGDYKGIPKQQVRQALATNQDVIMRIDIQGAQTIRRIASGAVSIFLVAESLDELKRRLRERRTEPPDGLKMRIATAGEEMKRAIEFDYIVVNQRDQLEATVDAILAIITAEKHRVHRRSVTL